MTTSKGHQHLCESQLNHHIHQYYNCPYCYHPITRPLCHSFYLFRFVPSSITSTLIINMTEIIGETKCKRSSRWKRLSLFVFTYNLSFPFLNYHLKTTSLSKGFHQNYETSKQKEICLKVKILLRRMWRRCNCHHKSHVFQRNTSTANVRKYLLFHFLIYIIALLRTITFFVYFFVIVRCPSLSFLKCRYIPS